MKIRLLRFFAFAAVAFSLIGPAGFALAAEAPPAAGPVVSLHEDEPASGHSGGSDEGGVDVMPVALWMTVGILVGGLVLGVFYLLKRRVGGFPEHPEWVAPISIERSATFAKEGDFGDVAPDAHGAHH